VFLSNISGWKYFKRIAGKNAKRKATPKKEAFRITEEAKVGVTPGIDFGSGGEGFLRFSYANSLENIKEGLDRLERYLD
jgi:aspartate/methionine/tyrosine aminotransferase